MRFVRGAVAGLLLLAMAAPGAAQQTAGQGQTASQAEVAAGTTAERPDSRDGVLWLVSTRVGFMITGGDGFDDRGLVQVDGGAQLGRARVGGPPAIGFTLGTAVGASHFLGGTNVSLRLLGGIELPWAVALTALGKSPVELVPAVQAGYMKAYAEDERSGFTFRATVGLRLLPGSSPFFFTFEPLSLVLLPSYDIKYEGSSRAAIELGLFKVGLRF